VNDLFETFKRISDEHMAEIRREQAMQDLIAELERVNAMLAEQRQKIAAMKADHA
jgi:hypothetical protein